MKVELSLDLDFNNEGPVKITCIYGRPTADPSAEPISLIVRDITVNGRILEFNERALIMECLGGKQAIEKHLQKEYGWLPHGGW